ncbi:tyrosine-protein phosphatase non-receptor type substrate [Pimephales promelas]|nr:tyrosine-protein phosphatase non-receptor type substrate [Pimephales promelas]
MAMSSKSRLLSHCDAFDYWGKGTQVTVSSAAPNPPTVYKMSQCEPSSDSLIVGCLASGFSPAESVSFKWMDQRGNALTDFIQYPTVTTGGKMLKVSHIAINETKWNQNNISCTAVHPSKTVSETFTIVKPQKPTLTLVPVTTPKSTSVMCVIEDFYPEKLTGQWKVNNDSTNLKLESKLNEKTGLYKAYSFYQVSSETWNANTLYSCEVTHRGKPIIEKKNFKAKFTLMLKPPIERELFVNNKVVLEAVVSGDVQNTVEEASVSCTVKNTPVNSENITKGNVSTDTPNLWILTHYVTIYNETWFNGEMVTCTVRDTNNNRDIKEKIHFDKGDGQKPKVTIYKPETNIKVSDSVSLVCEVTSHKLGDVYIMWKVDNEPYIEAKTSAPIHQKNSTSVLSILTLSKQEYEKKAISCAVKHANMDDIGSPLQVSTSKREPPEPEKGFALNCNKDVLEEDEFRSLWSTATSFIFLFLFSLTYSALLSLFKMKHS